MPTETVYGLACDALNREAVRRAFGAKGRPAENPLIVHIASLGEIDALAADMPPAVRVLAEAFWPGPLTMVLHKKSAVPNEVTGGLDTVAIRVPNHPVALALIAASGTPLAAPSANIFTRLSPTRVEHLDPALLEHVSLVLDAGPCEIGVESTVLDLSHPGVQPAILRPGAISRAQIERVIGPNADPISPAAGLRSPGQYPRHYAPRAGIKLVERADPTAHALVIGPPRGEHQISMPDEAAAYASRLYEALHEIDNAYPEEIQIEMPPNTPDWEAVRDRLAKAARQTTTDG